MALASIEFSPFAYAKILSHTMKYQHSSVNGILLGTQKGDEIFVEDAYPLFHMGHGLTPMFEIALIQLDTTFGSKRTIVGYYHAFENCRQTTPDIQCERIMEKLTENFKHSFMVLIDNRALSKLKEEGSRLPFMLYTKIDNSLRLAGKTKVGCVDHHLLGEDVIEKKLYQDCIDFDDHLENPKADWSNVKITDAINSRYK